MKRQFLSEEHKKHISEARLRRKAKLGYMNSPECRQKISESQMGNKYNLGYHHTEESKQKISLSAKNRKPVSVETRKKLSIAGRGRKHTKEERLKISQSLMGHFFSEETKEKIRIGNLGKTHSVEHKRKIRESIIKRISIQAFNGFPMFPTIGNNEKECLDNLEKTYKYKIIRQKQIIGYFLDGYIKELNLAIEFDEPLHFKNELLIQKDQTRKKEIQENLSCSFFRVKESDWLQNKEKILDKFEDYLIVLI